MEIHESAEDYLEMVLMLRERWGQVRSIDIVNEMGYTKPSVSIAMKRLRENGYLEMDSGGYITLTGTGMKIARRIYARHQWLTAFLVSIGVNQKTAETDACRMEHGLSDETFEKLKQYVMKHLQK